MKSLVVAGVVLLVVASAAAQTAVPADPKKAALCGQWMDWQLAVVAPAITPTMITSWNTLPMKITASFCRSTRRRAPCR